ncbi:MAG: FliH/SctL family protein [Holophaga sp.]|jgi:flagellar biosynthesis/type III secretory pathway protein FliH
MSVERIIRARLVDDRRVESFPYATAPFAPALPLGEGDDTPLGAALTTPEEDARRLASVDQVIFEKLQQAERDALDTQRRGYEEGFAAGQDEGHQFGESQYKVHLQRLEGHLQELSRTVVLTAQATRDEILALSLAVGEYLAAREISQGEDRIGPVLDAILAAHPFPGPPEAEEGAVVVHLHPRDLESLGMDPRAHPGVALVEDPDLSQGSLRIETAEGVLDASLEQRTALLRDLVQRFRELGM